MSTFDDIVAARSMPRASVMSPATKAEVLDAIDGVLQSVCDQMTTGTDPGGEPVVFPHRDDSETLIDLLEAAGYQIVRKPL